MMEVGAEIHEYKRQGVRKKEREKKNLKTLLMPGLYFLCSFLISRVMLVNSTAPFGIALILTIVKNREEKLPYIIGSGVLLGYVSLFSSLDDMPLYIIMLGTIVVLNYITVNRHFKKKLMIMFTFMFLETVLYRYVVYKYNIGFNFLITLFNLGCIFPLYFIMDYAIICGKELRTKHLFTNEEIISMSIMGCLIISGTWGLKIFDVSVTNIMGLMFIMIVAYINGSAIGAAAGVAMGIIVGISSNNMMNFISIYGVCGLIIGVFRETGKWFTALAYIVVFTILKLYSGINQDIRLIEGIITAAGFISIPEKIYDRWSLEFDWERKQEVIGKDYIEKVRAIFSNKLNSFSTILTYMASTLNDLVDNDKLLIKKKSSGLIENLADKVCDNCDMRSICWKREFHYTYAAFGELIQNYQQGNNSMPMEIERKCIKRTVLLKTTEDIVNNYIISEMWRKKLSEGRELLSGQINNMADTIKDIMNDFEKEVNFDVELELLLKKAMNKYELEARDIMCYEDRNEKLHITMKSCNCRGKQKCIRKILPIINEVSEKTMCVANEGCAIGGDGMCTITFEETPKFHIATYVEQSNKDGESFNGDSYSFGKFLDGTHMTVISDGMGCGYDAYKESKASVELIEKFAEGGFGKETTINTVNSIMGIRSSEQEKYSTLDLNSVDLYDGKATFIKVGAVESFIKSGSDVHVIRCKTLPIGVLDKVDVDIIERTVENGDIIITLSDGVLDAGNKEWIYKYLKEVQCENPKELAVSIIDKAKEYSKGKVKDDMTVMVSKIYSLY